MKKNLVLFLLFALFVTSLFGCDKHSSESADGDDATSVVSTSGNVSISSETEDIRQRLSLSSEDVEKEWRKYITVYLEENHITYLKVETEADYTRLSTVEESEQITTESGNNADLNFFVMQDKSERKFNMRIGLKSTFSNDITEIRVENSQTSVSFLSGYIDSFLWITGDMYCNQIFITDESLDISLDKIQSLDAILQSDEEIKISYYSSTGEVDAVYLDDSHKAAFCGVFDAFKELLTYYYQPD